MYTTKHAMIAYEHDNSIKSTIFYIDLIAPRKHFQRYLNRGIKEYGISYKKAKVARIVEDQNKNPVIVYEDLETGKILEKTFDLVILASSMIAKKDAVKMANILGIEVDNNNFYKAEVYEPQISSKQGIFLCGACREPMDIPTSVIDASGAAAKAAEFIIKEA